MLATAVWARKPSNALVAQGIEHRFPNPNYEARLQSKKTAKCPQNAVGAVILKTTRDAVNTRRFPTVLGNFCAEVVLESSSEYGDFNYSTIDTVSKSKCGWPQSIFLGTV